MSKRSRRIAGYALAAAGLFVALASVSVITWGAGALLVGPGLAVAGVAFLTWPESAVERECERRDRIAARARRAAF